MDPKHYLKLLSPPILVDLYRSIREALHRSGKPQGSPTDNDSLPRRPLYQLFPGIKDRNVSVSMHHLYSDVGSLPLRELSILGAICNYVSPRKVFEIGTYRGLSTSIIAMNTPDDAEIFTLDLPEQGRDKTKYHLEIGGIEAFPFKVGEYYRGGKFESKIVQLYGDSAIFDFGPFFNSMDLVFIDGNHLYDNVKSDSLNALRLIRPGGVIIWDDYHANYPGVKRCLHELAKSTSVFKLAETWFGIHVP
jgi:predicted O-methyltransferase YrrM